jgi:glutathione S-transferase
MQLRLYYSPGACSLAVHIVLRETGLPFELERVVLAKGEHLQSTYLSVNPRARVPTLLVDGRPIREVSAILTWLGQLDGSLYPPKGTIEAAKCAEWLAWLTSSVHISIAMVWRSTRFALHEHQHIAIARHGMRLLQKQFEEIEQALTGRQFLVGDRYTVADANVYIFHRWGLRLGFDMRSLFPAWSAHADRMLQRPAVAEALQAEEIPAVAPGPDAAANKPTGEMTPERLARFGAAWANHDLETLLSMMDDEAVYLASVGPEPGETFRGKEALRRGFDRMLKTDTGAVRSSGPSWIAGDIGVALWDMEFPAEEGKPGSKVRGIDLFEFKGDKILRKDAFRKTTENRPKK